MGKQFLEITEKKEVEKIIANLSTKLAKKIATKTEKVRIEDGEALGRIASAAIFSSLDIPPFDRSTMDGYAVVASDTFYVVENNPSTLIIKGYIQAGEFPSPSQYVETGYCAGISTGAPIPKGANAVVKVENTFEYEDAGAKDEGGGERKKIKKVRIYKPVAPAENIMLAGSDIKRGEEIVKSETTLTPRETGVLAACGIKEVFVRKKPTVAIISTGNEIIALREDLEPGKIYDVNAQTLSDSVREIGCGCVPLFLGIAGDNTEEVSGKIKESLAKGVDIIILSGGTSAGIGDVLPTAIEEFGEILVHGVDIKPGKPFVLGTVREKPVPVFGLPGNPTSALITFNLFVVPLLRAISGIHLYKNEEGREGRRRVKAKASLRIFSEPGRNEYVLVKLTKVELPEEDKFFAYPILTGSGAITSLSKADGYIFMEKGKEIIEEGEGVEVELLTKPFSFRKRKAFTEKKNTF
jgi:molybdopterin molybdotransferase